MYSKIELHDFHDAFKRMGSAEEGRFSREG